MKVHEVIENVCQTVALIYHSIANYAEPSDGFCHKCPNSANQCFQHSGTTLRYLRDAAVAKLKADGFSIASGFDPDTGDEVSSPPTIQNEPLCPVAQIKTGRYHNRLDFLVGL